MNPGDSSESGDSGEYSDFGNPSEPAHQIQIEEIPIRLLKDSPIWPIS